MAEEYKSERKKFGLRGLQLSRPVDVLEENKYAVLRNTRSYVDGEIQTRPGMSLLYALAANPTHTIKRLNDDVNSRSTYFTGAGTKLYADDAGHTAATEIDSGYSGDPISTVPHRPDQSPLPWLYFMDRTKGGRKAKSTAASDTFKSFPQGVSPPTLPPTVSLAAPVNKVVSEFDATAGWTAAGTAGAPALLAAKRIDTTIAQILFDTGSTGWASISPTVLSAQLQPGMRLTIDTGGTPEIVMVDDVFPAITSTTISSIQYDSGSSGPCTIVLTAPSAELRINSMLRLATAENVRVLSVTAGPQGIASFRCSTASTRAAGNAVDGLASFRASCSATHTTTQTLTDEAVESVVTVGTGTLSLTTALDLSISGTRPITAEDYMVIGVRVDHPELVTELKIRLDVADATNDFTKDFYEKSFRASDLTAAIRGTTPTLTVNQQVLQRDQIDTGGQPGQLPLALQEKLALGDPNYQFVPIGPILPGPPLGDPTDTQLGVGSNVWSTLQFQLKDMDRIGTDSARNFKNVAAIQIVLITTGTVTIDLDSWYIRGGFGLDIQGGYWAYRYRSLETKARSNMSPPTRSPLDITRGSVSVVCATKDTTVSGDPQVTVIDIYRFDDVLEDYTYVGSVANPSNAAATTAIFTDEFSDEIVQLQGDLAERNQFQPFPLSDLPRSGVVNVKGTEVTWVSGDTFNTSWGRGSKPLKINGIPATLYTNPSDSTHLSLNENLGTLTSATFEFPEALLLGQARPVMWGPYGGGDLGIFFFSLYLGTLLWTNPNNPDAASDANQLEITNPSEPLMNGFIFDGRPYVCSTERKYEIAFTGASFIAKEIANTKGLYARWGLTVAEGGKVYTIARDGLYEFDGNQDVCITNDLYPLFPHNGIAGISVNGFSPPDYTLPKKMRLSSGDGMVRFKYQDTGGTLRCMVFSVERRSWDSEDTYTPQSNVFYSGEGQSVHEELIGSLDGKLYRSGGTDDAGVAIAGAMTLASLDMGLGRQKKQFGDVMVDLNTVGVDVTTKVLIENQTVVSGSALLNTASRKYSIIDVNAGLGALSHNVALQFTWLASGPKFYEWIPSFIPRPDEATLRCTDWLEPMGGHPAWITGVKLDCDTGDVDKVVEVRGDGDALIKVLTLNHNGRITKNYEWVPQIHHRVRLVPTGAAPWMLYTEPDWSMGVEPEPELAVLYTTQPTTFDLPHFHFLRDGFIAHRSTTDITLTVTIDGVDYDYVIAHNSGNYKKSYVIFQAIKGKYTQFTLSSSAGARVYEKDCSIRVGQWGRYTRAFGQAHAAPYLDAQPFGETSRTAGARQ